VRDQVFGYLKQGWGDVNWDIATREELIFAESFEDGDSFARCGIWVSWPEHITAWAEGWYIFQTKNGKITWQMLFGTRHSSGEVKTWVGEL
jgi:hypothetical protein